MEYNNFLKIYNDESIPKYVKTQERWVRKNYNDLYTMVISKYPLKAMSFPQKMWHFFDLGSSICECGNEKKFRSFKDGYQKFCSRKCAGKYNIERVKETNISKYGVSHVMSVDSIKNKKLKSSSLSYINKKENQIKGLGFGIVSISDGISKLHCNKCSEDFEINDTLYKSRIYYNNYLCTNCLPINGFKSNLEIEVWDYISSIYNGEIKTSDRSLLSNKELDIYLAELGIAIEINGLYWHSEKYKERRYHLDKTEICEEMGIRLIHIYEDDWIYKQNIVKSRLNNLLGRSERIYARKCEIMEVISKDKSLFLDTNHIQGKCNSKINLGLYYNNELVSIMTFGSLRKNLGQVSKSGYFELLRFCNKLDYTVVGGASKLFKYFLKNYDYTSIISYADRSWSKGSLYRNLGFEYIHKTMPNYYYVIDSIRYNRFRFRKDLLVKEGYDKSMSEHQIMLSREIYRLYDSGSLKYEYV